MGAALPSNCKHECSEKCGDADELNVNITTDYDVGVHSYLETAGGLGEPSYIRNPAGKLEKLPPRILGSSIPSRQAQVKARSGLGPADVEPRGVVPPGGCQGSLMRAPSMVVSRKIVGTAHASSSVSQQPLPTQRSFIVTQQAVLRPWAPSNAAAVPDGLRTGACGALDGTYPNGGVGRFATGAPPAASNLQSAPSQHRLAKMQSTLAESEDDMYKRNRREGKGATKVMRSSSMRRMLDEMPNR